MAVSEVEVIYSRVPAELKRSVEAHASETGKTLTSAVIDLLERGLEATSSADSVRGLEQRIADLGNELHQREEALADAQSRLGGVEERERGLRALAQRASQTLGSCPQCRQPIRGYDLLATGTCPNCHRGLSNLITSAQAAGIDQTELLVLIAALGLILGATYLATKNA